MLHRIADCLAAFALTAGLAFAAPAWASLSSADAGLYARATTGLSLDELPFTAGVGWHVGAGAWFGKYDDAYALGRFVAAGLDVRQAARFSAARKGMRTAIMAQVDRGIDLLVVGVRFGGSAGALLDRTPTMPAAFTGGTVRANAQIKYRWTPEWGAAVRFEGGVDITDRVEPVLGLMIGIEYASTLRNVRKTASRRR